MSDLVSRGDLVNQEWSREYQRKESLERRGITVITTSGVLVTLIFAFSGAVAKGHNLGNFTLGEKIAIGVALGFFVVSAAFGVATNSPRNFAALEVKTLRGKDRDEVRPQDLITEDTLRTLIDALVISRERDDTKAAALTRAIALQVAAVFIVGITIMIIII